MLKTFLYVNLWCIFENYFLYQKYTVQLVIIKFCTKFQNCKSSSSWEIHDQKKLTNRQTN